jgi:hypothetical protein
MKRSQVHSRNSRKLEVAATAMLRQRAALGV